MHTHLPLNMLVLMWACFYAYVRILWYWSPPTSSSHLFASSILVQFVKHPAFSLCGPRWLGERWRPYRWKGRGWLSISEAGRGTRVPAIGHGPVCISRW